MDIHIIFSLPIWTEPNQKNKHIDGMDWRQKNIQFIQSRNKISIRKEWTWLKWVDTTPYEMQYMKEIVLII